jgi:hypothetical protein
MLKTTRKFSYNDPQRQKLSKSPRANERVRLILNGDWKSKFLQLLENEIKTVMRKISEYQQMVPHFSNVDATVIAGLDVIDVPSEVSNPEIHWDILITSPPYLQAQEYIRSSKIDLFWLGYSEEAIKNLSKKELPYRKVDSVPIYSKTYDKCHNMITETNIKRMFERYFYGVLGTLTKVSSAVDKYLFLFVGPASVRSISIPIDRIFTEHFVAIGWQHELTLVDPIPSRVMFRAHKNPATGLKDNRIASEQLVILKRKYDER